MDKFKEDVVNEKQELKNDLAELRIRIDSFYIKANSLTTDQYTREEIQRAVYALNNGLACAHFIATNILGA